MKTYIEITDFVSDGRQLNTTDRQMGYDIARYYFDLDSSQINFIAWSRFQRQFVRLSRCQIASVLQPAGRAGGQQGVYRATVLRQSIYFNARPAGKPGRQDSLDFDKPRSWAWVEVKIKNDGLTTWRRGETHLDAIIPSENLLTHPGWQARRRVTSLKRDIHPGESAALRFAITVPSKENYLEEFFQLTDSSGQYFPGGRVRVELLNRTKSPFGPALKAKIIAVKLKNRLAICLGLLDKRSSRAGKIVFVARQTGRFFQSRLKRQRFVQIHKQLFLRARNSAARLPQLLRPAATGLTHGLSYLKLALYKIFLPWRLEPRADIAAGDLVFLLSARPINQLAHYRKLGRLNHRRAYLAKLIDDMIPVQQPQFVAREVSLDFAKYYRKIFPCVSLFVADSDNTKQDIKRQLKAWRIASKKIIKLIPGTDLTAASRPAKPPGVKAEDYALCVASLDIRKNHNLLAQAYRLADEQGIGLPHLYLVGQAGWLTENFVSLIRHDPVLKEKISHLGVVSDRELAWLYRQARYTVYPSHYEGWGLPVSESLAYGCVTLSSRAASLPEVGGRFADYFSPYSAQELLDLMARYQDGEVLAARRRFIGEGYRPPSRPANLRRLDHQIRKLAKSR